MTKFKIPNRQRIGYLLDAALTGAVLAFGLEEIFSGDWERGLILGLLAFMRFRFTILESRVSEIDAELVKTDAELILAEIRKGR